MYLLLLIAVSDVEMKREADSNDISAECCSHHYQPTVGMFLVFLMFCSRQSFLCVRFTDWLVFYLSL